VNKKGQKNRGRRLKPALNRFSSILIEEALELTSLSIQQLNEALGLPEGQAERYLHRYKDRGPQAGSIQELENRVAKLLKRTAHTIVIENTFKVMYRNYRFPDSVVGKPADNINLRDYGPECYELRYENDWPTFYQLKHQWDLLPRGVYRPDSSIRDILKRGAYDELPPGFCKFSFQWGVLWDKGIPWLKRELFGVEPNTPIEAFLPELTAKKIRNRNYKCLLSLTAEGRKLLSDLNNAIHLGQDESDINFLYEKILAAGEIADRKYRSSSGPINDDSAEYVEMREFLIR
jgi:hypothetical protein